MKNNMNTYVKKYEYPYNLISDVYRCDWTEAYEETGYPFDIEIAAEHALNMLEDEQERDIIHMYYRDGMTLKAIGEKYGRSCERIRQIYRKGVKKLREPSKRIFFEIGIREYIENLKNELARKDAVIMGIGKNISEAEKDGVEVKNVRLSELEFSKRAFACFSRLGIETLAQLVEYSEADLFVTKGCGAYTANEISEVVKRMGLSLKNSRTEKKYGNKDE